MPEKLILNMITISRDNFSASQTTFFRKKLLGLFSKQKLLVAVILLSMFLSDGFAITNSSKIAFRIDQNNSNAHNKGELELNKEIEQDLLAGETDTYTIKLEVNHYLQVLVEQKGIDVNLALFDPKGEKVYQANTSSGVIGLEPLYLVSKQIGNYSLEVHSLDKAAKTGKYKVKIVVKRPSVPGDIDRIAGLQALAEGDLLRVDPKNAQLAIDKLQEAIKKLDIADEILSKAIAINSLGEIYFIKADYTKAESLFVEALEIRKKFLGENHPNTASSINNLALLYKIKGNYAKAEPLYIQALEIFRKTLGEEDFDTTIALNNLAGVYIDQVDYTKAEPLLNQSLNIRKKILEDSHPLTTAAINNLAFLYKSKADYAKAESLYNQALEIKKKVLGENHSDTATVIDNLAEVFFLQGNYAQTEILYTDSLEIRKKVFGENHPAVATSLMGLANLYKSKGDFSKAEDLLIQALEMRKKILGENHPDTATSIIELGFLYYSKQDYDKSEMLFAQALEIRKKIFGENHAVTATSLASLALIYKNKKEYEKAETFYLKALEIRKKFLGENHPFIANIINNLGSNYHLKGDYEKTENCYLQALEIRKKTLGENHPDTISTISNFAVLSIAKEDYENALKYAKQANDAREKELIRNLFIGSERQKQLYVQKYSDGINLNLSLHAQLLPNNTTACQLALTEILRRKGRSIDAINQNVEALYKRSKPEDIALLDELKQKKTLCSNLITQGLGKTTAEDYQKKLKSLQNEIDEIEFKISKKSFEFGIQIKPITLQAVQQAIPQDSTLIEFASYNSYNAKTNTYGKKHYVAYLLNNQGEPTWVELGEAEIIDRLIEQLRLKLRNKKASINKEIKPLARKLDEVVMQPVRKLTEKGKRLLLAPDGKLNLIPFAALVDENGKYLVENYSISYLTSGRDLLRLEFKIDSKQLPVIIGNPDFGPTSNKKIAKTSRTIFARLIFNPLEGTQLEAKAIKELFPDADLLLQKQATEEALNKVVAPLILHIATHGFFLQNTVFDNSEQTRITKIVKTQPIDTKEPSVDIKVDNPLLLSGIALAGANTHQNEKGIFTALKTTNLNLWGTKLVVLSACDTGVGEVKTGDGVYGLRRALVLAGSESQILSLWAVSDAGTKDLMVEYYKNLQNDQGRAEALRQVQIKFLKSANYQHPYFWASFIQSGEWANLDGKR